MSTTSLDILALEPFYGGPRKAMLEALMRYSRHRWTVLKLPPRRIERRLQAASIWFAEQLSRHWVGPVDVVFTSEAMNLADLLRLAPALADKPRVVYFHDNQMPAAGAREELPHQTVNLTTANAANEIWFNSTYHLRSFMKRASALVERHPELAGMNPLPKLAAKAQLMPPPVDLSDSLELVRTEQIDRDERQIFVDTREADMRLLNHALLGLARRGERYRLMTVGPVDGLDDELPRETVGERDEVGQVRALHESAVLLSARRFASQDHHAVRALQVGCWPVFPNSGVYPELLPASLHGLCLYDGGEVERLVNQLQNVWWIEQPANYQDDLAVTLAQFDPEAACHAMDERLEQLAIAGSVGV